MAEETSEDGVLAEPDLLTSSPATTPSAEAGPKEETPEQNGTTTPDQNGTTTATHPETAEDPDPILDQLFFAEEEEDLTGDAAPLLTGSTTQDEQPQVVRQGTISSARFNMWATMVGGGSLSLPLAFQKTGNALGGPLILIATAFITEFCFRVLVDAARTLHPPSTTALTTTKGKDSYEGIAAVAFGNRMLQGCTLLVTLMCFFGIVGYAVLLRDMLEPVTDAVFSAVKRSGGFPSWQDNLTMVTVALIVTPLCTLQTLTALQRFGAASMAAIGILGVCVTFRSLECTFGWTSHRQPSLLLSSSSWLDGFRLFPDNWKDVLDVIPLFISCYVCHYNIPVVHNELRNPTVERVQWWLKSTVWGSTLFYLTLGIAGSAYGACAPGDSVHGNILLDFAEDDPLLLIGRLCLAVTIALAFPMLTIPARDILIRLYREKKQRATTNTPVVASNNYSNNSSGGDDTDLAAALREPLLAAQDGEELNGGGDVESASAPAGTEEQPEVVAESPAPAETAIATAAVAAVELSSVEDAPVAPPSLGVRLLASVVVLWTGTAVASCVSSIDIVWDLLGSSLSILLSYLIPCGSYLVIARQKAEAQDTRARMINRLSMVGAWLLLLFFTPLMFVSTANAVYNTFFR